MLHVTEQANGQYALFTHSLRIKHEDRRDGMTRNDGREEDAQFEHNHTRKDAHT